MRGVCATQLGSALGDIPFFINVISRSRNEEVWATAVRTLHFPNRAVVVQMVLEIQDCLFPEPGSYLLELYCDDVCVTDVPLLLLNSEKKNGQV